MKLLNENKNTKYKSTKIEFCYISTDIVCVCVRACVRAFLFPVSSQKNKIEYANNL